MSSRKVENQMTTVEEIEVVPDASRIVEGLRDTGYDYNTAVADIVDNSIAAGATRVIIGSNLDYENEIRVTIADNGSGMNREELVAAMRYGSPTRPSIHSLGKFGLGLKTASTACCRRLKVITRKDGLWWSAVWDLDYLANQSGWNLQVGEPTLEEMGELEECAGKGNGTLVVWEKCDKLLSARYSNPRTDAFKKAFIRSNKILRQHLAMVYQRFLDAEDKRAETVEMELNGEPVESWDPFCREMHDDYGSETISIEGTNASVKVVSYVVTPRKQLVDAEERKRVWPSVDQDLKQYSDHSLSGFYIYRENRLIKWGDWFNTPGIDFHNDPCRFELSFSAELDDQFQVDIKKSRIILNDDVRDELVKIANIIKKEGDRVYRSHERREVAEESKSIHEPASEAIAASPGLVRSTVTPVDEGTAKVGNKFGDATIPYGIVATAEDKNDAIQVVESIDDGLLWEPVLVGRTHAVSLNAGHEFYKRFYGATRDNPNAQQAMDFVFWTLAQAETEAMSDMAVENLQEARYETSKKLRDLAKKLPEASIDDFKE